jgi:hypothetical protein
VVVVVKGMVRQIPGVLLVNNKVTRWVVTGNSKVDKVAMVKVVTVVRVHQVLGIHIKWGGFISISTFSASFSLLSKL